MSVSLPPLAGLGVTPGRLTGVPFARQLASYGSRTAVTATEGGMVRRLSYAELADRIADMAARLGTHRRLVLIHGANRLDPVVAYLAALAAGHPVILAPAGQADAVARAYDPDVEFRPDGGGTWQLVSQREHSAHELHPDLALLMSTSGSTGSPKLVRLSTENVQANAESIAQYLSIRETDCTVTTLPLHYCYGLSVVHTHLLRGAEVVLTELSVVDACFWDLVREHRVTSFAGVPHTFELLDRVGFAQMRLPHLRYVTQAGGRMPPERVRRFAELGRSAGWELVVMYGQTEATARMAYLPPDLAESHPQAIGRPIPGGAFALHPVPGRTIPHDDESVGDATEAAVGELVYTGPNVMLGYARTPADLALGRTVDALHTGDLARRTPEGLYEIVGRLGRFVKVAGLRIDLDHLESVLARHGVEALCAGDDGTVVIAWTGEAGADRVHGLAARQLGQAGWAVQARHVDQLPRLSNGKPDYPAVAALTADVSETVSPERPGGGAAELRALYAHVLGRRDVTDDSTFVDLGGDSLSYVEMSVRLEHALGHVPTNWHVTPIRDLVPARRSRFALRRLETSVLLRAVAIVAVVGTHAKLFALFGGAHVLLAVAGFNFARFRLTSAGRRERQRQQLVSLARIAVPSMVWIAAVAALTGGYEPTTVILLNGFLGSETWDDNWHFWFVEVLVYIVVGLTAVLAVPWVDRMERRFPFGFALVLLTGGLLTRYELVGVGVPHMMPALWLFALGWAASRARGTYHRLLLTLVAVAAVPGFFGNLPRETAIVIGITLLIWVASVPVPAVLVRVATVLAGGSLYIYLVHWQVYPLLTGVNLLLAVVASLVAGILAWMLAMRAERVLARLPLPGRRRIS